MSKTTGKKAPVTEPVVEQVEKTEVKSAGYAPILIPTESVINRLVEAETGMELTTSYRTKEEWMELKNKPINCFFMGTEEATNAKGKKFDVASFVAKDCVFVAGQKVLVDAVKQLPVGQGVQITYTGSKSNSSDGQTLLFKVKRLNATIADQLQTAEAEEGAIHE